MEKSFRNERHRELYEKFKDKQMKYFMVLGGAKEEDAKEFSLEKYRKYLNKNNEECDGKDLFYGKLALQNMEGSVEYDLRDYKDKPFYCRVLDNIVSCDSFPVKFPHGDPVYDSIIDLSKNRFEEIFDKQFIPFSDVGVDLEMENGDKYSMESMNKQSFLSEMIYYFNHRGKMSSNQFPDSARITEKRYNFLLENLVNSSEEEKSNFEEEFVRAIPGWDWEGFYFWPKE